MANQTTSPAASPLLIEAFNIYDSISIRGVRSLVSGRIIDSSTQDLEVVYGEHSYLFVYRFGCLVFVNVPPEKRDQEIARLKAALGPGLSNPTYESYRVTVEETPRVEFELIALKKISADHLRLIAVTVGRSAALEFFEQQADRMVHDTSNFLYDLSKGAMPWLGKSKKLLQIIGSTASTRQHVLSNISILDPPETTWKSKELERLYTDVQDNFDIEIRFRVLDRKLTLTQDNIEILANLVASRRNTVLEASIVALIVFEIVLSLVR